MAMLKRFLELLDRPVAAWARISLVLLVVPLALSFTAPLWRITLEAPQYPKGLHLDIYSHKIEGGNGGRDLTEINNLNHYIGMHKIDRAELSDLDWLPFAVGILALLALRVAAVGNVRSLIDLAVLSVYFAAFSAGRFAYKLYVFGHHLDPTAPFKVEPFAPPIIGTRQIANFTATSWPQVGTAWLSVFLGGVLVMTVVHLARVRRPARPEVEARVAAAPSTAA
jgi:hypothetical protein